LRGGNVFLMLLLLLGDVGTLAGRE